MIVIFGSTSDIAKEVAKEFARKKENLVLVARNVNENERIAKDLQKEFGIKVETLEYDAQDLKSIPKIVKGLKRYKPTGLFIAQGFMPKEFPSKISKEDIEKTNIINYKSPKLICEEFIENYPKAKFISVISSVAGDVEKIRTLHYGKSKAKISDFLNKLRKKTEIRVIDIKPGPTRTKMTSGMKLPLGGAKSSKVARDIIKGIYDGKEVVYTPFYWKHIMKVIKVLPKGIRDKL